MRLLVLLAGIALAWRPVCLQAQEPESRALPTVELPADVDRVLRDYEQAWAGSDPKGLADLFTEDGFVLRPGRPPVRGRAGILRAYQNAGGRLALRALDFVAGDSVGYVIGGFSAQRNEPDVGKFVLVLRRGPSVAGSSQPTSTTGTIDERRS